MWKSLVATSLAVGAVVAAAGCGSSSSNNGPGGKTNSVSQTEQKGAIGQKYLAIGLGHSRRTLASGATVPLRQTSATVDLDQVLDMFSPPTRAGVAASTVGFSDGLTGRGIGRASCRERV